MDLVIEQSKWLCGDNQNSMLYRPKDGKMCCLGFLACKVGYSIDDISNQGTPSDLCEDKSMFPSTLIYEGENTSLCNSLVKVNDNPDLKQIDRESILRELFKSIDIQVSFVS